MGFQVECLKLDGGIDSRNRCSSITCNSNQKCTLSPHAEKLLQHSGSSGDTSYTYNSLCHTITTATATTVPSGGQVTETSTTILLLCGGFSYK